MWLQAPALLSLYGLLVRTAQDHTLGKTLEETIPEVKSFTDKHIWGINAGAKAAVKHIEKHGLVTVFGDTVEQRTKNWKSGADRWGIHGCGIQSMGMTLDGDKITYIDLNKG
jgi:hypothetical protein